MSAPTRSLVQRLYLRALASWPKDILRPETEFHTILAKRIERQKPDWPTNPAERQEQLRQANALYSLLENRYLITAQTKKSRATLDGAGGGGVMEGYSSSIMKPKSNPKYYDDLIAELEALPTRTWWGKMGNRIKGMIRFSE